MPGQCDTDTLLMIDSLIASDAKLLMKLLLGHATALQPAGC
jgi:hypothetical protein